MKVNNTFTTACIYITRPVKRSLTLPLLFILILAGCSTALPKLPHIQMLPQNATNRQITSSIQWQGKKPQAFLAIVELKDQRSTLVAVTHTGLKMFSVVTDNNQLTIDENFITPADIDPEQLLNALLLIYLPEETVQEQLPPPWTWITSKQNKRQRKLMYNKQLVLLTELRSETVPDTTVTFFNQKQMPQHQFQQRLIGTEKL